MAISRRSTSSSALAQRYDAWLMSDDAHGLGVLGDGRGSFPAQGTPADIPLQMGTLSKAHRRLWRLSLRLERGHRPDAQSRPHADLFDRPAARHGRGGDRRARRDRARARHTRRCRSPRRRRSPAAPHLPEPASPIVPLVLGDAQAALDASRLLEEHGFLVAAIRPPTVPAGTARLRFTFTAQHPDAEIERLAAGGARPHPGAGRVTAIFVTATGTDIGKTFVTAGLIRHYLRSRPRRRRDQAGDDRLFRRGPAGQRRRSLAGARSGGRSRCRRSSGSRPGGSTPRCLPTWRRGWKAATSCSTRSSTSRDAPSRSGAACC